jgi:acyl carrier protein
MNNEQKIREILISVFPLSDMPKDIASLKIGDIPDWDSLGNFNLLLAIEDAFNIRFSVDEMSKIQSISQIIEKVNE